METAEIFIKKALGVINVLDAGKLETNGIRIYESRKRNQPFRRTYVLQVIYCCRRQYGIDGGTKCFRIHVPMSRKHMESLNKQLTDLLNRPG